MRERDRPSISTISTPVKIKKPTRKKHETSTASFVLLPKAVLKHPPIAHRGRPADGLLSVFEIALATGIVTCARARLGQARHAWAVAFTRTKLDGKRQRYTSSNKRWRRDEFEEERAQYGEINHDFRSEGKRWYRVGCRKFDAELTEPIAVEGTKSGLLRGIGRSRGGADVRRLDLALKRLMKPVTVGSAVLPPLLTAQRVGDKVRLLVDPAWVPRAVGKVATPLPTRGNGTITIALYLFLAGIDTRADSRTSINAKKLCRLIGIGATRPAHIDRALKQALAGVNDHLKELNAGGGCAAQELPVEFDIEPVGDGTRVRCRAKYEPRPDRDARPGMTEDDYFDLVFQANQELDRRQETDPGALEFQRLIDSAVASARDPAAHAPWLSPAEIKTMVEEAYRRGDELDEQEREQERERRSREDAKRREREEIEDEERADKLLARILRAKRAKLNGEVEDES